MKPNGEWPMAAIWCAFWIGLFALLCCYVIWGKGGATLMSGKVTEARTGDRR